MSVCLCSVCACPESSVDCLPCPKGHFCPTDSLNQSYACPEGYYVTTNGPVTCEPCPAGFECSDPPMNPVPCQVGFSVSAFAYCLRCPNGRYTIQNESSTCQTCPAGNYCSDATSLPTRCAPGYYSSEASIFCLQCPSGHHCADPAVPPVLYLSSTYAGNASVQCLSCPAGSYCSVEGLPGHYPCQPGHFSNSIGAIQCSVCPVGHSRVDTSATPSLCPQGTASPERFLTCVECPIGFYANVLGTSDCISCPQGYNAPLELTVTTNRYPAFYVLVDLNALVQSLIPLAAMQAHLLLMVPVSAQVASGDFIVQKIYYCPDVTRSPISCPRGQYSLAGTAANECTQCPEGTNATISSASCTGCPAGISCSQPDVDPTVCPAGTYSTVSSR